MLSSCLNLAGCYPISCETGQQSRQVLRRKFGTIYPYSMIAYKTKQVQACIVVTVNNSTALVAAIGSVA